MHTLQPQIMTYVYTAWATPEGDRGLDPPPPKNSQKWGFLAILSRYNEKLQSYKASMQCLVFYQHASETTLKRSAFIEC